MVFVMYLFVMYQNESILLIIDYLLVKNLNKLMWSNKLGILTCLFILKLEGKEFYPNTDDCLFDLRLRGCFGIAYKLRKFKYFCEMVFGFFRNL